MRAAGLGWASAVEGEGEAGDTHYPRTLGQGGMLMVLVSGNLLEE